MYCKQYICSTTVCFDILISTVNNYHAIERIIYFQLSIIISPLFVVFRLVFRSWPLLPRSFEITLRHSKLSRHLRTSEQTLRPLHNNTQQTNIHVFGGIRTPIPTSERTQTHVLDHPATGIGFSIIYTLYLALRSTKDLLEQHNKTQDSENKLANFIIKKEYTKTILCSIDYVM